jgi:hypothetical protein
MVRLNRQAAIAAGRNVEGDKITLDIDVSALSAAHRSALSAALTDRNGMLEVGSVGGKSIVLDDPTPEALVAAIDAALAEEAEVKTKHEHAIADAVAKIAAADDATLLANWSDPYGAPDFIWLGISSNHPYAEVCKRAQARLEPLKTARQAELAAELEARKAAMQAINAQNKAAAEAAAAAKSAWIAEHGSDRLKRLAKEGIEHGAVYRDERLAIDHPGWIWDDTDDWGEPRNAPVEALDLLDRARASIPEAVLKYACTKPDDDDDDDDGDGDTHEYVAAARYVGRWIIMR